MAVLAMSVPTVVSLLGYAIAALRIERFSTGLRVAMLVAWLAHGIAVALDIGGVGLDAPGARFGFAPALSITLWLVLAVYGLESRFVALAGVRRRLALLAAMVVLLAWLFPGQPHGQIASPWAPVHWVLGIASYGLMGAAVLHAVLLNRAERRLRQMPKEAALAAEPPEGMPLLQLERLTFRFVAAGFVVLSAAILLGAGSASAWRWDHKTVLSLLGWVVFAALLAGRQAFGWRGPQATRWLYVGAGLLLLAYVGSRFVLEVLLNRAPVGAG